MLFCMRTTVVGIADQRLRDGDAHDLEDAGSEKPGSTLRMQKGADHQHRADQQHQRHGYLGHNQYVAARCRSRLALAVRAAPSSGRRSPRRSISQRRDGAEKQAGEHGEKQREGDGPPVERDLVQARQLAGPTAVNRRSPA